MLPSLLAAGIMTGNSLDGADLVATRFDADGTQTDLASYSVETSEELKNALRWVREKIAEANGDVESVARRFARGSSPESLNFDRVSDDFIDFIADAVQKLAEAARGKEPGAQIDLLGFHGQTCAHNPPSNAGTRDPERLYTVQIGDGQRLADLAGIPVVYDFRSDDLMRLGEAAPLAPIHHRHLAAQVRKHGHFPIAFLNGGNTGNITVISERPGSADIFSAGWDSGPFNNFPDKLMQRERAQRCDRDGLVGATGRVNLELLGELFHQSVVTKSKENFLLKPPPKSSDPEWYRLTPALSGETYPGAAAPLPFEDRLRTAEYFSAYLLYFTLQFIPADVRPPKIFAVCGGGWRNPIVLAHFKGLLSGNIADNPVLPEHREVFASMQRRFAATGAPAEVRWSDDLGFDGTAMEARIFADAAVCRLTGEPFTIPETTGVSKPTVGGIVRYPGGDASHVTPAVRQWIEHYRSRDLTIDRPDLFDRRWSRASAGWYRKLNP